MNKISIIIYPIISFVAYGCSNDIINNYSDNMQGMSIEGTHVVSIDEAQRVLEEVLYAKNMRTRSFGSESSVVSSRYVAHVDNSIFSTRASCDTIEEVDSFYVFNIGENDGYAIMSSDNRSAPILVMTDNGSLSEKTTIENDVVIGNMADAQEVYYDEMRNLKSINSVDECGIIIEYSPWQTDFYNNEGGMCVVHWGQGYPYNLLCPNIDGEICLTGCVSTAVAQLMSVYSYPYAHDGYSFNWDDMISSSYDEGIPMLMKLLGEKESLDISYGLNASSGKLNKVPYAIKHFSYSSGGEVTDFSANNLINELICGYPVLVSGYSEIIHHTTKVLGIKVDSWNEYRGGHLWLAHGIMRMYRTKKIIDVVNNRVLRTESDNYYYIMYNFGWSGYADGYYLLGNFDTNKGADYSSSTRSIVNEMESDSIGDPNNSELNQNTPFNYQFKNKIIWGIRK